MFTLIAESRRSWILMKLFANP